MEEHRCSRGRLLGAAAAIFLLTCFFGVACANEELQGDYDELYAYSENLQRDYDELYTYSEDLQADYDELYAYSESRESEWVAYVEEMDEFLWRSMMEQSMVRRQDLLARTQNRRKTLGPQ